MITQALTPQLITWHFLKHFLANLKVTTVSAHLPVIGNLAAMQSTVDVKGADRMIEPMIEEGAIKLATSVDSIAEAAGATHISFEELTGLEYVAWHTATDRETGVSVRIMQAYDLQSPETLTRFDVCYRLWKLLPGKGA